MGRVSKDRRRKIVLQKFRDGIRDGRILTAELTVLLASEYPISKVSIADHHRFYTGYIRSPDSTRQQLMKYASLSDKRGSIVPVAIGEYTLCPESTNELLHLERLGFIFYETPNYVALKNLEVITELGT